jgi:hypothetical protein
MLTLAQAIVAARRFVKIVVVDVRTALPQDRNEISIYVSSSTKDRIYPVEFTPLIPSQRVFW